jgi:hypothetical protein
VVNLLSVIHELVWTQYPAIWLCESCAILWLVVRAVRSRWVQAGVLLMLCGLMLNAMVTDANTGVMPVVGIPPTLRPVSPMWRVATPQTRLAFLGDQSQLGLFSIGDLAMLSGGILILAICLHRTLKIDSSLNCKRLRGFSETWRATRPALAKLRLRNSAPRLRLRRLTSTWSHES